MEKPNPSHRPLESGLRPVSLPCVCLCVTGQVGITRMTTCSILESPGAKLLLRQWPAVFLKVTRFSRKQNKKEKSQEIKVTSNSFL